jgi:hypothetical protein
MSKVKITVLIISVLLIFSCSVFFGPRIITPIGLSDTDREILISIRLPRVLVALLMGMALGASGAVLQGSEKWLPIPISSVFRAAHLFGRPRYYRRPDLFGVYDPGPCLYRRNRPGPWWVMG